MLMRSTGKIINHKKTKLLCSFKHEIATIQFGTLYDVKGLECNNIFLDEARGLNLFS